MGKAALLLTAATVLAASLVMLGQQRTAVETDEEQGNSQEQLLAEKAAEAGLNLAISQVKRDFDEWRAGYNQEGYEGGAYDVNVIGSAAGPITVAATGQYGEASHYTRATLSRLAPGPAAVVIDADTAEVALSGSDVVISGKDTRPVSVAHTLREGNGAASFVNGVWTRSSQTASAFLGAGADGAIRGLIDQRDITQGTAESMDSFPVDLATMLSEALGKVDQPLSAGTYANQTFGSASQPEIVVVNGDAQFSGQTKGYGLLVVRGNLTLSGNFEWEGVVLAESYEEEMNVTMSSNAAIRGGLVVRHELPTLITSNSEDECNPVDFDITGDEITPNEDYRLEFNVLGAAISYGGQYDVPVTARILIDGNSYEPWGDWDKPLDADLNSGGQPSSTSWSPDEVFSAGTSIRIDARSWVKKQGKDGDRNNEWRTHMEVSSSSSSHQLTVLRDGNNVPDVGGFQGQADVLEFVSGYVDGDAQTVALEDDEVINLFELGETSWSSSAFDIQDLVVVVRILPSDATEGEGGCGDNDDAEATAENQSGPPQGTMQDPNNSNKVIICHVPPGNPENAHTISISRNAHSTHFSHHDDYDGYCQNSGGGSLENGDEEQVTLPGVLRFNMHAHAAVHYSAEAIGKLAALLPSVRDASWVVKYDQMGDTKNSTSAPQDQNTEGGD